MIQLKIKIYCYFKYARYLFLENFKGVVYPKMKMLLLTPLMSFQSPETFIQLQTTSLNILDEVLELSTTVLRC